MDDYMRQMNEAFYVFNSKNTIRFTSELLYAQHMDDELLKMIPQSYDLGFTFVRTYIFDAWETPLAYRSCHIF